MAETLAAASWTAYTKKQKLEKLGDDALLNALAKFERVKSGPAAARLEALGTIAEQIPKQVIALTKKKKELGDKVFDGAKDKLYALLEEAERLQKEARTEAAKAKDAEEEPDTPALLSSKMTPLLTQLKASKGETRMYALVCTAGKNTAVLVMRSPISSSRRPLLMEAVDAKGGAKFIEGECLYENGVLTFVLKSPAGGLAARVHKAIFEQTTKKLKVKVRGEDGAVDEGGEEDPESPTGDAGAGKTAGSAGTAPAQPSPGPTESGTQSTRSPERIAYEAQLAQLRDPYDQALAAQHPESTKIRALMGFASEKADGQGDFNAAAKALDMLARLLAAPVPPRSSAGGNGAAAPASADTTGGNGQADPARAFTARLAALVPRIKANATLIADAGTAEAKPVATLAAEAGALAKSRQFDAAQALLERIEAALNGSSGGGLSLVRLGKARLEWIAARNHALREFARLKSILEAEYQGVEDEAAALKNAQDRLDAMMQKMDEALELHLDRVLNAEATARPPLIEQARAALVRMAEVIQNDPLLALIDGNEYAPDMAVAEPMRARLADISAAMS